MPAATVRYLRRAPAKVRQVLGLIRGLEVDDARETLRFCERAAAEDILKVLDSAIANAENNDHLPTDELYVERAWADEGPTMHRYRPRARGRATAIRKRMSHVTIVVSRYSDEELELRNRRKEESGVATRTRRPSRRKRVAGSVDHDREEPDSGPDAPAEEAVDEEAED